MRTVGYADAAIVIALPVFRQHSVLCKLNVLVRRYADQAAAEVSTNAGFSAGTRYVLHESVHIGKAGSAALEHFDNAQHCTPIDVVRIHFVLDRPDFILQPVHERHIVSIAAQQRHRYVTMSINHAGRCQLALAVDDFVSSKVRRNVLAYIDNLVILNRNALQLAVRRMQQLDIFY